MEENSTGIWISAPGNSVYNANPSQLIMNTANPFLKLDTQNPAGFDTFELLINTDPPEPSGPSWDSTYTIIHSYPHTYKYIPTIEMLCLVQNPPPSAPSGLPVIAQDFIMIDSQSQDDGVIFYAIADATDVYLIIKKYNDGSGSANLLTGTNLLVSVHVFVEDLLSQA
jgi:hypothetical protein